MIRDSNGMGSRGLARNRHISKWRGILITTLVFTILMIPVVELRFWVRRRTVHRQDWTILVTMLFSVIYSTSCIIRVIETRYGGGLWLGLRPKEDRKRYFVANYAAQPYHLWGIAGFELALCLSYLRMTEGSVDKWYRQFIIAIAILSSVAQTRFVVLYMFSCVEE